MTTTGDNPPRPPRPANGPRESALRTLRWHVRELMDLSQMAMVADEHDLAQALSDIARQSNDLFAKLAREREQRG